jgi:hypothetical protein
MEVSGQLYPQEKSPWYALDRRLSGWASEPFWRHRNNDIEINNVH